MTELPPLPRGIDRDATIHGRIYFTRQQMQDYGRACADAVLTAPTEKQDSDLFDRLFRPHGGKV